MESADREAGEQVAGGARRWAFVLLVDPEPGQRAALGQLRRALGWADVEAAVINDPDSLISWFRQDARNRVALVIGDHVHPGVPLWIGHFLAWIEDDAEIDDVLQRTAFVLLGRRGIAHSPMASVSWDAHRLEDVVHLEVEAEAWFEPPPWWKSLLRFLARAGHDARFDGRFASIHLRLSGEPGFPHIAVLDGDLVLGRGLRGDEGPATRREFLGLARLYMDRDAAPASTPAPEPVPVHLSSVAPAACRPGSEVVVEALLHLPSVNVTAPDTHDVRRDLQRTRLRPGTPLSVVIDLPRGITTADRTVALRWQPPLQRAQFLLRVSPRCPVGVRHAKISVRIDGTHQTPVFHAFVGLNIDRTAADVLPPNVVVHHGCQPTSAFISYATADWAQVLPRIDMLKMLVGDDEVFVDCLDVKAGALWEDVIQREIIARQAFFFFWSPAAKASKWVTKEWRHRVKHRKLEWFIPCALQPAASLPPPKPLRSLQFGSPLLSLVRSSTASS